MADNGMRWLDRDVPDIAEARSAIGRVVAGAQRASNVIQQLRAVFWNDDTKFSRVDMMPLVESTLLLIKDQIDHNRIKLVVDIDDKAQFGRGIHI